MIVSRECSAGNAEQALAAGADEFFSQPLRTSELLARVRALLRRCGRASAHAEVIRVGDLRVDQARRRVYRDGEEIRLTPTQYSILLYLIENRNRVVSGRMLLERIWGPVRGDYVQTLRVHIGNLRRKIERDPARPRYLVTESRAVYRFVEPEVPFEVSA